MTKKDYQLIAEELHHWTTPEISGWLSKDEDSLVENIVIGLAKALKADNPKFDTEKFHKAVYKD